jgi:hypothetical protein
MSKNFINTKKELNFMKKKILLLAGILALSSLAFGGTDESGHTDTDTFNVSAEIVTNLDVALTGDLEFGDMVIADGVADNTKTLAANASEGVTVAFTAADDDETVSVALSGTNVTGTQLSTDTGAVTVDFSSSTGTWAAIPTTASFYIGGLMTVASTATGDTTLNEDITVTVTYDSIS